MNKTSAATSERRITRPKSRNAEQSICRISSGTRQETVNDTSHSRKTIVFALSYTQDGLTTHAPISACQKNKTEGTTGAVIEDATTIGRSVQTW